MIYRVHRPHNPDGSYGTSLGYIHLCHGHINPRHICSSLLDAKLIPEHWFVPEELQSVAGNSNVYGVHSYTLVRRAPHRNHLFYLHPIESNSKSDVWAGSSWIGDISSTSITFTSSYIVGRQSQREPEPEDNNQ